MNNDPMQCYQGCILHKEITKEEYEKLLENQFEGYYMHKISPDYYYYYPKKYHFYNSKEEKR